MISDTFPSTLWNSLPDHLLHVFCRLESQTFITFNCVALSYTPKRKFVCLSGVTKLESTIINKKFDKPLTFKKSFSCFRILKSKKVLKKETLSSQPQTLPLVEPPPLFWLYFLTRTSCCGRHASDADPEPGSCACCRRDGPARRAHEFRRHANRRCLHRKSSSPPNSPWLHKSAQTPLVPRTACSLRRSVLACARIHGRSAE